MRYFKLFLLIIITALSSLSNASAVLEWQENPAIAALFAKAKVKGTFVLYDVSADKFIGHDYARAQTRFFPASTFKFPNSLIGLSTGAVKDINEVFPYDGKPKWIKAWEKDMDLREAFKLSNVTIYQEIARRVGLKRMQAEVKKLAYGNEDIGNDKNDFWQTPFWLEGPLKISAIEQTQFLKKLAQKTLPFPLKVQEQVHEIAQLDQGDGWTLYAKTGWTGRDTKLKRGIGWWVGWVKKGDHVYAFALNIDMPVMSDASKRIELGRASLKELNVLN